MIARRRLGAETVVMPIERLLTCQIKVMRFCWHVYEMTGAGALRRTTMVVMGRRSIIRMERWRTDEVMEKSRAQEETRKLWPGP
jgi:hypothetical protein